MRWLGEGEWKWVNLNGTCVVVCEPRRVCSGAYVSVDASVLGAVVAVSRTWWYGGSL